MKTILYYFFILFVPFVLLSQKNTISNNDFMADCPFLTKNQNNDPVLCWVEGEKENTQMVYSISTNNGEGFEKNIYIQHTKGLSPHHESMPKIAFKSNGTIVAVFQKRVPTTNNRFAGAIYYTQSFDDGLNWTKPQYLHADTTQGIGRSFFDIAVLPDGEIGAIWLDGRKKRKDGSSLFFAKTKEKIGFQNEIEIAKKTCQCCRTEIYVDQQKNISISFRKIFKTNSLDNIRDMAYLVSGDNGKTFSKLKRVSEDNWVINGCPHTGPTITSNNKQLDFFWFTMGNGEGVYHTIKKYGKNFQPRKLINAHARHPQASSLSNGKAVLVWDENFKTNTSYINRIGVMVCNTEKKANYITPMTIDADHPVVLGLNKNKILVAWVQFQNNKSEIVTQLISF